MIKNRVKLNEYVKLFKPADAIMYGLVVLIMLAGFLNFRLLMGNTYNRLAIVELNGEVLKTFVLEPEMEQEEFRVDAGEGQYVAIALQYDYIMVISSNCRDQVCVGWGRIRYSGQAIVCLPYRVVVRITGRSEEESLDDITW